MPSIIPQVRTRWSRLPLRIKVIAPSAAITLLAGLLLLAQAGFRLAGALRAEHDSKGRVLAVSLAAAVQDKLISRDTTSLQGLLDAYMSIDDVVYAFVVDENGKPVVHTFSPSFPAGLEARNAVAAGSTEAQVREVDEKGYHALDVAVPVLAGALGTAHVGMDLDKVAGEVRHLVAVMSLTLMAVFAGGAWLLWWGLGGALGPLRELHDAVKAIIDQGDLTRRVARSSEDEIGELAGHFNEMVQRLQEIPAGLGGSVALLGRAVESMESTIHEQESQVNLQAAALQQTQVTAQEIKQTSMVASQRAADALAAAGRAGALAQDGEAAVERTLSSLASIRTAVDQLGGRIGQLDERARQIGGITDTVKDLADQSNMLALNAAIEAVRSGEHGKGFGLVAREIRRLADQSIQSTNRVQEILEGVGRATQEAVKAARQGSGQVEGSLGEVRNGGESFKALAAAVKDNAAQVREIASAVAQQNTGISQIFTAVTDQNRMMLATAAQLEQTRTATQAMRKVSDAMQAVMRRFKVD